MLLDSERRHFRALLVSDASFEGRAVFFSFGLHGNGFSIWVYGHPICMWLLPEQAVAVEFTSRGGFKRFQDGRGDFGFCCVSEWWARQWSLGGQRGWLWLGDSGWLLA